MRYSGWAGRGWVLGEELRSVRGFWEAVGWDEEAVGSDADEEVVELNRMKGVDSGCIRGKAL